MNTRFRLLFLAFFRLPFFKLTSQQTIPTKESIAVIGIKNVQKKIKKTKKQAKKRYERTKKAEKNRKSQEKLEGAISSKKKSIKKMNAK